MLDRYRTLMEHAEIALNTLKLTKHWISVRHNIVMIKTWSFSQMVHAKCAQDFLDHLLTENHAELIGAIKVKYMIEQESVSNVQYIKDQWRTMLVWKRKLFSCKALKQPNIKESMEIAREQMEMQLLRTLISKMTLGMKWGARSYVHRVEHAKLSSGNS